MRGRRCSVAAALLAALAGASAPPAGAAASEWAVNPESRVRLVTPYRVAPADGEVWLGLHFRLEPEWHVYWKNSGDAGFPPVIEPAAGSALASPELTWPAPERYQLPGDLVAYGYADEVVYPVRARLTAAGERADVALEVDYLVCRIDCIPYRYTLRVDQPVAPEPEADPETAALLAAWRARLPVPVAELPGVETRGRLDVGDLARPVLTVDVEGVRPAPGERPELFFEVHDLYEPERPELQETASGLHFRVPLNAKQKLERAPENASFAWTVTGLARPADAAEGVEVVALEAERTVSVAIGEAAGDGSGTEAAGAGAREASTAGVLLRSLAGGLLLAATPGALALVLVLMAALRRLAAERPADVAARTVATTAGTLAAGLAFAAADLAMPGSGWNRLLQSPPAVAALALATLLFALGLWGFLARRGAGSPASVGSPAAAFAAGALLALLAVPWPLPPAAPALDRAAGVGGGAVLSAALAVAAGLALPVLVAGLVLHRRAENAAVAGSGGRSREGLGFLAAVSVLWLLYVLAGLLESEDLAFVELSLLGVGLAVWGRSRAARPGPRYLWGALAAAAGAAALWISAAG